MMFWVLIVLRFILLAVSCYAYVYFRVSCDGGFVSSLICMIAGILNAYSVAINFASLVQCYSKWKFGGCRRYWDE